MARWPLAQIECEENHRAPLMIAYLQYFAQFLASDLAPKARTGNCSIWLLFDSVRGWSHFWALGVSRSGLYDYAQKPDGERRSEDDILAQKISLLFLEGRCTYDWRQIQKCLLREGIACGKKRILRLMRDQELEVIQKRAFRPKTTQSRHDQPIAPIA
jgi:hypothetical protein